MVHAPLSKHASTRLDSAWHDFKAHMFFPALWSCCALVTSIGNPVSLVLAASFVPSILGGTLIYRGYTKKKREIITANSLDFARAESFRSSVAQAQNLPSETNGSGDQICDEPVWEMVNITTASSFRATGTMTGQAEVGFGNVSLSGETRHLSLPDLTDTSALILLSDADGKVMSFIISSQQVQAEELRLYFTPVFKNTQEDTHTRGLIDDLYEKNRQEILDSAGANLAIDRLLAESAKPEDERLLVRTERAGTQAGNLVGQIMIGDELIVVRPQILYQNPVMMLN